jgi:5-methylthioribose kinase
MQTAERTASFRALAADTIPERLANIEALTQRVGRDPASWRVREIGDGNVNLVFVVEGDAGSVILKQALPYFRLVGASWPLSLRRSFFECQALLRQQQRAPGFVPDVLHFDEEQAFTIMERLDRHVTLRRTFIEGRQVPRIADDLGLFMAQTLFRGSDFHMTASERKADLALFAGNIDLCDVTEYLVFSAPFFEASTNRHTTPHLDDLVATLRADRDLKVEAQKLKHIFATKAETLVHGDLHTGSVMTAVGEATRIIDPEFAFYGPISFDVGILLGNCWMSYFSQRGYERDNERADMRAYLLQMISDIWTRFCEEFRRLWRTERVGMLYQRSVFEDQGDDLAAEQALNHLIHAVWEEALGFAGVDIHRRIMGLAHIPDFEQIPDPEVRAKCEARALQFGRHLVVNGRFIQSMAEANDLAAVLDNG